MLTPPWGIHIPWSVQVENYGQKPMKPGRAETMTTAQVKCALTDS